MMSVFNEQCRRAFFYVLDYLKRLNSFANSPPKSGIIPRDTASRNCVIVKSTLVLKTVLIPGTKTTIKSKPNPARNA